MESRKNKQLEETQKEKSGMRTNLRSFELSPLLCATSDRSQCTVPVLPHTVSQNTLGFVGTRYSNTRLGVNTLYAKLDTFHTTEVPRVKGKDKKKKKKKGKKRGKRRQILMRGNDVTRAAHEVQIRQVDFQRKENKNKTHQKCD